LDSVPKWTWRSAIIDFWDLVVGRAVGVSHVTVEGSEFWCAERKRIWRSNIRGTAGIRVVLGQFVIGRATSCCGAIFVNHKGTKSTKQGRKSTSYWWAITFLPQQFRTLLCAFVPSWFDSALADGAQAAVGYSKSRGTISTKKFAVTRRIAREDFWK
jgi:hypothetical protein